MNSGYTARRATVQVSFGGVDITGEMEKYLLEMEYTDNEGEEVDDLQIHLQDREGQWAGQWIGQMVNTTFATLTEGATGQVGDRVEFTGSRHYVSSTGDKGYPAKPGWGRITAINPGAKHPYHLVREDDTTNLYGWVNEGDIVLSEATTGGNGTGEHTVVPAIGLNVRSGPGTGYGKLGALKQGETVTVLSAEKGWAKISYAGKTGYVSSQYLSGAVSQGGGMRLETAIVAESRTGDGTKEVLHCGSFELDSVEAEGPPGTLVLQGTAVPYGEGLRQKEKSRGWERERLSSIAGKIAEEGKVTLLYLSQRDPQYERVEQYKTSDIAFLRQLCGEAGVMVKVTGCMLILYDREEYTTPVRVITPGNGYTDYTMEVGKAKKQYQSCRVSYTDPATGKSVEGTVKTEDWKEGKNDQQLEVTAKVGSIAEAEEKARWYLQLSNQFNRTAEFTFPGDPELVAGSTVMLQGWGYWDGRYLISRAVHRVDEGGYTSAVSLRWTGEV